MNELAAAKIKMMQASIRCLVLGMLAFLPLIGLPFAIAALWLSGQVRRLEKRLWNPAKPYRLIGITCAALGTIGWFLVGVMIAIQIVSNTSGN
jgi:hypothetical protein